MNRLPVSLRSELVRECPVKVRMLPADELEADSGFAVLGRGGRKETGGAVPRAWFFLRRAAGLAHAVLDALPMGAVLGRSTLSSRTRGIAGAGAA